MFTKIDKAVFAAVASGGGLYTTLQTQTPGLPESTKLIAAVAVGLFTGIVTFFAKNKSSLIIPNQR